MRSCVSNPRVGVRLLLVFLVMVIPSRANTNSELRSQIMDLQRRMSDYPQFADELSKELASVRKELRDQLHKDFEYFRALSRSDGSHQQAYAQELTNLASEIDALDKALASMSVASIMTNTGGQKS